MRILGTERLALRWLEAVDACFVLELVNDPDWLDDVDLGFAESALGLRRLAAIVSPENHDSRRLLARLGMQFERMVHPPFDANAVCLYASTRPGPLAEAPC